MKYTREKKKKQRGKVEKKIFLTRRSYFPTDVEVVPNFRHPRVLRRIAKFLIDTFYAKIGVKKTGTEMIFFFLVANHKLRHPLHGLMF